MHKIFKFHEDAMDSIQKGIETLAKAVKSTLGPRGKTVVIYRKFGPPICTKDGVTVAKEIDLEDDFENMGAQLVKEVASKTADQAGDGTTTAIVLAEAIFNLGRKAISSGANGNLVCKGIYRAVDTILHELTKMSTPIESSEDIRRIATISANNDKDIGNIIGDAMDKVGRDGIITMDDSPGVDTTFSVVEGMQIDRGFASQHFMTDPAKGVCEFQNAYVLIINKKISTAKDIVPILQLSTHQDKLPLVVIADDIEAEALSVLVLNKIKAGLPVCAIRSPAFGDRRKAILEDIAILTGAQLVTDDLGISLSDLTTDYLGACKSIRISREETIIMGGYGKKEDVDTRVAQIKREITEKTPNTYDYEKLKERLAKLVGGIAVIHVGAATEAALIEKKARVEDALQATKAAVAEGIVVGGGVALLRAIDALDDLDVKGDEAIGVDIIRRAAFAPATEIANNAGKSGNMIAEKIYENKDQNYGFNGLTGEFGDLKAQEVIDPVRVTKSALINASSISVLLLNTSAMIGEVDNKSLANIPEVS